MCTRPGQPGCQQNTSVPASVAVSPTRTPSVSRTPSKTPTVSVTPSPSGPPGASMTPTVTPTVTPSVTKTPGATPTKTPSSTPSISVTPSISKTTTPTPTPSPSADCSQLNIFSQMQQAALQFMKTDVAYYKADLSATKRNIYGESLEKWYFQPILAKCSITRDPDTIKDEMFGPDIEKIIKLTMPKAVFDVPDPNNPLDGIGLNFLPEIGDIIYERSLNRYFEVHNIIINYEPLNINVGSGQLNCPPVELITYQLECHHTRVSRLNLLPEKII